MPMDSTATRSSALLWSWPLLRCQRSIRYLLYDTADFDIDVISTKSRANIDDIDTFKLQKQLMIYEMKHHQVI